MSLVWKTSLSGTGRASQLVDNAMNVYVGWDSREAIAYDVCVHPIRERTKSNPSIVALKQAELRESGLYWRGADVLASTQFTYTRFLVPLIQSFTGWALFMDCDFLVLSDIARLFDLRDERFALQCVKHDYVPKDDTKMDGQVQTRYPRKNWSSLVLWNCSHPSNRVLSADVVNSKEGSYLHRFQWLADDEIGEIPVSWNWLEGEYSTPDFTPDAVHFTRGGPWFPAYRDVEFAELWRSEHLAYGHASKKGDGHES